MLDTLPKYIINYLFIILSITAKRNFIRCNHEPYLKMDLMLIYDTDKKILHKIFTKKYNKTRKIYLRNDI